jgi:hypothetical protein
VRLRLQIPGTYTLTGSFFSNGLFESHRSRAPVVLIASQITTDDRDPQEVDFAPIYKSCSVTDENSFYWT